MLKINDFFLLKKVLKIFTRISSRIITVMISILLKDFKMEETYKNAFEIVQYGWKKEAIPIIQAKKSFISRFFCLLL